MEARVIYQYDLEGNYVGKYSSVNKANKSTGINVANISRVATGSLDSKGTKRHVAGGYQWSYTRVESMKKIITPQERAIINAEQKEKNELLRAEKKRKSIKLKADIKAFNESLTVKKVRKQRDAHSSSYYQYSLDGIYIRNFENEDELIEYIGDSYNKKWINQACAQIIPSLYGCQWRYYKQKTIDKVDNYIFA